MCSAPHHGLPMSPPRLQSTRTLPDGYLPLPLPFAEVADASWRGCSCTVKSRLNAKRVGLLILGLGCFLMVEARWAEAVPAAVHSFSTSLYFSHHRVTTKLPTLKGSSLTAWGGLVACWFTPWIHHGFVLRGSKARPSLPGGSSS